MYRWCARARRVPQTWGSTNMPVTCLNRQQNRASGTELTPSGQSYKHREYIRSGPRQICTPAGEGLTAVSEQGSSGESHAAAGMY